MISEKINSKSPYSLYLKYLLRLRSMHFFSICLPVIILIVFMPIFAYVLKLDYSEIVQFVGNIFIIFTFIIPFAFLPISIDCMNNNHIHNTLMKNRWLYPKFMFNLIWMFFIYYVLCWMILLFVVVFCSLVITNSNGDTLFNYLFSQRKFNGSLYGNALNWGSMIWSMFISYIYCFGISMIIHMIFNHKNSFIVIVCGYIISFIISPFIIPTYKLLPQNNYYQYIYYLSIFYYPGMLNLLAWSGYNVFSTTGISGFDNTILYSSDFIVTIDVVTYVLLILSTLFFIYCFVLTNKYQLNFIAFMYSINEKAQVFNEIVNKTNNVGIATNSTNMTKQIAWWIYQITRSKKDIVCIANNIETFIPELTFYENFQLISRAFDYEYDITLLNELIYYLNLQVVVNRPIKKLLPNELIILNILFALMIKPNKIVIINPLKNIDRRYVENVFEKIKHYLDKNNIKVILISKRVLQADIFCDEIMAFKSFKVFKTFNLEEWRQRELTEEMKNVYKNKNNKPKN